MKALGAEDKKKKKQLKFKCLLCHNISLLFLVVRDDESLLILTYIYIYI